MPLIICYGMDAINMQMWETKKLAFASRAAGVVLMFIGLGSYAAVTSADISSETYERMAQFCLSNAEIERILEEFRERVEGPEIYNPIDGYNLDLKAIREMRNNLQVALRGKTNEPGSSFFYSYRGTFNMILGEDEKALGDFSEARRLCESAPIYPWLSLLYSDSGLREHAVHILENISCEPNDDSLCDQKLLSLILLDELDLADSISNQNFLWSRCIIRMVVDLLQNRKVKKHCDYTSNKISGLSESDRFAYDVVTMGRLGEEYRKLIDNDSFQEIQKYASFYISLNLFQHGDSDKACDAISDVLDMTITGKRLFYEYQLAKIIQSKRCSNANK